MHVDKETDVCTIRKIRNWSSNLARRNFNDKQQKTSVPGENGKEKKRITEIKPVKSPSSTSPMSMISRSWTDGRLF